MNKQSSNRPKILFVLGGVMSGIGKGITTASLAKVLQSCGYQVSAIKADPYLNVDAGTMNPSEHGEVFVLDSGLETDQDMGNYERFLNVSMPAENYLTNGLVFKTVIDRERAGGYHGKCVEPTQHITKEIIDRIEASIEATKADITIVEIGGTIGEYQNAIFIEAARRIKQSKPQDVGFVLVTYLPNPPSIGEPKTKPTQNAVRQLNSYGVQPNIIVARSEAKIDQKRRDKITLMCGVPVENIISAENADSIYDVPTSFLNQNFDTIVKEILGLDDKPADLSNWNNIVKKGRDTDKKEAFDRKILQIAIFGKYFSSGEYILTDAYISVIEALKISGMDTDMPIKLNWLDSEEFDSSASKEALSKYDGIIIPGGFGSRGINGKINVITYARENKIPLFGLCYGMQLICIEYARNICNLENANTVEIDPDTQYPIVALMDEQQQILADSQLGGTMRLGSYQCTLKPGSIAANAYKVDQISERHRHRYEINPEYVETLQKAGLVFSGTSPDGSLMEIAELPIETHPFFLGTQFHPEFLARVENPHPLFNAFLLAVHAHKNNTAD